MENDDHSACPLETISWSRK
jgi:hypothetical protein